MSRTFYRSSVPLLYLISTVFSAPAQDRHGPPDVIKAVKHDLSPPLRDIHVQPSHPERPQVKPVRAIPRPTTGAQQDP
ncbi:MAG TPA: hypothetical protein VGK54_19360, partial [Chloroflexota bacterium]